VADLDLSTRKPVKKYDRRSITSVDNGRRAWGKHLETQIVALANSTKDDRVRLDALKYLYDRHAGKPFTATNPAERKGRTMVQDNRLQLAIHQLIMPPAKAAPPVPTPPKSVQSELPEAQSEGPSKVESFGNVVNTVPITAQHEPNYFVADIWDLGPVVRVGKAVKDGARNLAHIVVVHAKVAADMDETGAQPFRRVLAHSDCAIPAVPMSLRKMRAHGMGL